MSGGGGAGFHTRTVRAGSAALDTIDRLMSKLPWRLNASAEREVEEVREAIRNLLKLAADLSESRFRELRRTNEMLDRAQTAEIRLAKIREGIAAVTEGEGK